MHELSIATSLVSLAQNALEDACEERAVESVRIRVGALSGVVVESLEFAWDIASEGTRCAGSALVIERVAARVRCGACLAETKLADPPCFVCAHCKQPAPDVIEGRELDLISLELHESLSHCQTEQDHAATHP